MGGIVGKSIQWIDLSVERRELGRAAGGRELICPV